MVPTLTLSSPSVHDQYFVPSPNLGVETKCWIMFMVSCIKHRLAKHYHVSKCRWQRVRAGRNNHVLEKLHPAIMSWFAICRVSFPKHSNKHESCKHESGQTRPPANTIFTMNFSISQNFPQTNLLKMTLLQLTYSGEIICKKIASCPNESPH